MTVPAGRGCAQDGGPGAEVSPEPPASLLLTSGSTEVVHGSESGVGRSPLFADGSLKKYGIQKVAVVKEAAGEGDARPNGKS